MIPVTGPLITPIGDIEWRTRARVRGTIRSLRVQPWGNIASLECLVVDETGGVLLVFLGRRKVAGIELGRAIEAEGMVGQSRGYLAILSPEIELLAPRGPHSPPSKSDARSSSGNGGAH